MSTFTNRNKSVSGSRKNSRSWHSTVNQRIDDALGSQRTMRDFSSGDHSRNVSTSIDNLTLPITGLSDITPGNSQYNDQVSLRYMEFANTNMSRMDITVCDRYTDNESALHEIQRVAFKPQDSGVSPKDRIYVAVDGQPVPYSFRDVLVDRNTVTNTSIFLTPTSLAYKFMINNEETRGARISPYGYYEYYDGVIFRLFYSKCYKGWNVATNYLANGDKYVVNNIKLGRMFMDIFRQTPDIELMLDVNSIYYFVFSHPYATYDPEANVPRVIFLARQNRSNGSVMRSSAFDGKRVNATSNSSMMFRLNYDTIEIVQRTTKYSTVSTYTKQHIRASKASNRRNLYDEKVDTANPFSEFGQRLLTTMYPNEVHEADTKFLDIVPRYRTRLYELFFSPIERDIYNVSFGLQEWLRQCWYFYRNGGSDSGSDFPELTMMMTRVLRNGLKDHINLLTVDDIGSTIQSLDEAEIDIISNEDFKGFTNYMYNMPYSLLINLFIEFYGTFMPMFIAFLSQYHSDIDELIKIRNEGKNYIKKSKTTTKKPTTTTVKEPTRSRPRDMWA